jgi:hypothetical protein
LWEALRTLKDAQCLFGNGSIPKRDGGRGTVWHRNREEPLRKLRQFFVEGTTITKTKGNEIPEALFWFQSTTSGNGQMGPIIGSLLNLIKELGIRH